MSSNMGIGPALPVHLPICVAEPLDPGCSNRATTYSDQDERCEIAECESVVGSAADSESALMRALASGDNAAMTALWAQYQRLVLSVALKIVQNRSEADEVVQGVFFDLYRAANQFDVRKGSIKVWVLQYAYHRALHRKRHLSANRFYDWEDLDSVAHTLIRKTAVPAEMSILLGQLLASLELRQQNVVKLAYFEGFTAEEISGLLSMSVHVVRHDLRRALHAMREKAGNITLRAPKSAFEGSWSCAAD